MKSKAKSEEKTEENQWKKKQIKTKVKNHSPIWDFPSLSWERKWIERERKRIVVIFVKNSAPNWAIGADNEAIYEANKRWGISNKSKELQLFIYISILVSG